MEKKDYKELKRIFTPKIQSQDSNKGINNVDASCLDGANIKDTKIQNVCECGHFRGDHDDETGKCLCDSLKRKNRDCSCKKFTLALENQSQQTGVTKNGKVISESNLDMTNRPADAPRGLNDEEILKEVYPRMNIIHTKMLNKQFVSYGTFRRLIEKAISLAFEAGKSQAKAEYEAQVPAIVDVAKQEVMEDVKGKIEEEVDKINTDCDGTKIFSPETINRFKKNILSSLDEAGNHSQDAQARKSASRSPDTSQICEEIKLIIFDMSIGNVEDRNKLYNKIDELKPKSVKTNGEGKE